MSQQEQGTYLGNSALKDVAVNIEWTKERIELFKKCREDPIYFIKNYVKVVTLDEGITAFNLWPFQQTIIDRVHNNRFSILMTARQCGKCVVFNNLATIKEKKTGKIKQIPIGEFFELVKKSKSSPVS